MNKWFLQSLLLICLISSCAPAYIPNVVNAPLLSNKGEFQGSLNYGISGFDPQVSYAVTDHFGLMMNGSFENETSDSSDYYHKHNFVELGAGYFEKINRFHYEFYGGAGFGNMQSQYDDVDGLFYNYANVNMKRIFIQQSIGFRWKFADLAYTTRWVYLNLEQQSRHRTAKFIEPAITFRVGGKHVKYFGQLGLSFPFKEELHFDYQPFMFSMGVFLNFGNKDEY